MPGLEDRPAPGTGVDTPADRGEPVERDEGSEPEVQVNVVKEAFFPTIVYFCEMPDYAALNEKLLAAVFEERQRDPEGIVRSNVKLAGSWHSKGDLHQRPEFRDLVLRLDAIVGHMFIDLNYHPDSVPVCDQMWAVTNQRFGYNRYHTHPEALWSGVYYLQTPKDCGQIRFRDPREQANFKDVGLADDKPRPRELWQEVRYEPKPGRVIFFPGWLGHEVDPNLSQEQGVAGERVIISFNYHQGRTQREVAQGAAGASVRSQK